MVVLVCIGSFAGCTSGEGGTVGNTELNVIVPNGAANNGLTPPEGNNGSTAAPGLIDIQSVEYTINCEGTPSNFLDDNTPLPNDGAVQINGNLEVVDGRTSFASGKACELGDNHGATCAAGQAGQDFCAPGGGTCEKVADFGPNLRNQSEIWQGFMDLPTGDCTVQLRARDNDTEVICTATEDFTILVDSTTKVNVLMICDVSFQAPVGMLDVDGSFSFVVGNFCPSAHVINCVNQDEAVRTQPNPIAGQCDLDSDNTGAPCGTDAMCPNGTCGPDFIAAAGCQVRATDVDSTCGTSCDPQICEETVEGLVCTQPGGPNLPDGTDPGPDPGLSTIVACGSSVPPLSPLLPVCVVDCNVDGTPDFVCMTGSDAGTPCNPAAPACADGPTACVPGCSFAGDLTGMVGQQLPGPLNPGEGGFVVAYPICSFEVIAATGGVLPFCNQASQVGSPLYSGADCTCLASISDGDTDCDKSKDVTLTGPGDAPCVAAGCIPGQDCAFCDSLPPSQEAQCTSFVCDDSSGAPVCNYDGLEGLGCVPAVGGTGTCDANGVCQSTSCLGNPNPDESCNNDNNDCTFAPTGCCDGAGVCCTLSDNNVGDPCGDSGTGSGVGTCDGAGSCDSIDVCVADADCDGSGTGQCNGAAAECLFNDCVAGGGTNGENVCACDQAVPNSPPTSCNANAGVCVDGSCELPPVIGACDDTANWRALPKECPTAVWDPDGAGGQGSCSCPDTPGADVPGGGSCGPFSGAASVVAGCEAPGGVLNAQLALDVFASLAIQSAADTNDVTHSYRVEANAPLLSDAAALTTVDGADVFSDVVGGAPAVLTNRLNPACAFQFLGVFTQGTDTLLLDADPLSSPGCTIDGVELLPATTPVIPDTTSTQVDLNFSGNFAITLTLSSGDQIIVDGAGCAFDNPAPTDGSPVICPVQ